MRTRVTELLGIKYPILQGAMAWVAEANLVSAVSNAGGSGILASGGRDADWVVNQIRKTKTMTQKPFGINVSLETSPRKEQIVDAICQEKVDFVTLGAGDPIPYIDRFHSVGIKVAGIIPNTRLAKRVEAAGMDFIIIEGMEGGGRIGKLTTMSLMSNVIPEVKIPVVVAGGIIDGRGMAASFIMGASAIQMGTRFLLAEECVVHDDYKNSIINATDEDSVTPGFTRGKGMRGLKSPFTEKYHEMEISGVTNEELRNFVVGCSRRVAEQGLGADGMNGMVQCGQSLVSLKNIQTAKEIIEEIVNEAEDLLKYAPFLVNQQTICK
jgi:enoyl-[acyl-carrier protein] reductase II